MQQVPGRIPSIDLLAGWVRSKARAGRPAIVGVCGYPGAGKTTVCRSLAAGYPGIFFHLKCDRFSRHSLAERNSLIVQAISTTDPGDAAENPQNWYSWEAIEAALAGIRDDGSFAYPQGWNRKTGELDETYVISLPGNRPVVLLCDCIYLLHPPVRGWLDAAILVDTPLDLALERGRSRSRDPARAAYMEHLARTYTVPYFAAHGAAADVLFSPDGQAPASR